VEDIVKASSVLQDYLHETQAADELHQTVRTLRRWREERKGPAFVRVGRKIFYPRSAIAAWLEKSIIRRRAGLAAVVIATSILLSHVIANWQPRVLARGADHLVALVANDNAAAERGGKAA
jgi:hypothetical protein